MADIKQKLGSATAMTITLASLADDAARQSDEVDNTTNLFFSAKIAVKVKTGTPSGSTGIHVYLFGNANDLRDDGCGASDAAATVVNAKRLGTIAATAATTTYIATFDTASLWPGGLPAKWGIIVLNETGGALDGTGGNHSVYYQGIYAQSA